jgi:hypothetical protein
MATSAPPTSTGSSKLDAVKANVAANIDPTAPTGIALYSRFAFAGAVCCSVTHGALTPVDVYVPPPPMARRGCFGDAPDMTWERQADLFAASRPGYNSTPPRTTTA